MADFLSKLAREAGYREPEAKRTSATKLQARMVQKSAEAQPERKQTEAEPEVAAKLLKDFGLFDEEYYLTTYPDVAASGVDPFEHFFLHGFKEGRKPNAIFDPIWYVTTYPDVLETELQPLLHYAKIGEAEGRRPVRSSSRPGTARSMDPGAGKPARALLKNPVGPFSPIPEFDAQYYLQTYPDIALAGVDPFEHFVFHGYKEGRNPSVEFDTKFYVQRYFKGKTDQNPLLHYLEHRHEDGIFPLPPENEATIPAEIKRFTKPSAHFEELRPLPRSAKPRAKILAYYLTQFHAFPENDEWWGTGFTEWTNIARGLPRFEGHYQPRMPRDLGHYSLQGMATMRRQIEARARRRASWLRVLLLLVQRPPPAGAAAGGLSAGARIDLPFCLMWANENWTRRWDGTEARC